MSEFSRSGAQFFTLSPLVKLTENIHDLIMFFTRESVVGALVKIWSICE